LPLNDLLLSIRFSKDVETETEYGKQPIVSLKNYHFESKNKRMNYYKFVRGVAYDRALIHKAEELTKATGDGRISQLDMEELFQLAQDGGKITAIEERTLLYIAEHFKATEKAKTWFSEQKFGLKDTNEIIKTVIRDRLGFETLEWVIDAEEVALQERLENQQTFEQALYDAINGFIREAESSTSLRDIIASETGTDLEDIMMISTTIREWLEEATLYLVPFNLANETFDFVVPESSIDLQQYWVFGLEIPTFTEYNFISYVRRRDFEQVFSFGYLPESPSSQDLIASILELEFQLKDIDWQIPSEEIKHQRKLAGNIEFSTALRSAMHSFIYHDEDVESLRSLVVEIHQEVKPEQFKLRSMYDDYINDKIKKYLNEGVIYLVPENIHQLDPDDYEEVYPPEQGERVENNWVFMLSLPTLSDHIFWSIVERSGKNQTYSYGFN